MSCLGERLTALVDGELGHQERDRALAHLAACDSCRAEADALRRLKGRLRGLGGGPADGADELPSGDFMSRLRALGEPGGTAGPPGGRPGEMPRRPLRSSSAARPTVRVARSAQRGLWPRDGRPIARAVPARRRYLAAGAATLFLGLGTASYVAGGRQDQPTVTPAFDRFAVEHALTSGDAPMTDPLTDPAVQTDQTRQNQTSPVP